MPRTPIVGVTYSSAELDDFLLWRRVFQGIVALGGTPLAIDCAGPQPRIAALVSRLDGLMISGGGDVDPATYGVTVTDHLVRGTNRHRDIAELEALDTARTLGLPILTICRGTQLANVAFGGTLYADLKRDVGANIEHERSDEDLARPQHPVDVVAGSLLAQWLECEGVVQVNSQHHQGIQQLGHGLVVTATSPDGLIEGFESPEEGIVGVQWHPEVLWPTHFHARALLANFIKECAKQQDRDCGADIQTALPGCSW